MACSKLIKRNIARDCNLLPVSGTRAEMILLNFEEVIELVRSATNSKEVTAILRKAASKGVLVEGYDNSNAARESFGSRTRLGVVFTHEVDFLAQNVSPETYEEIENLAGGSVIAVVATNNQQFKILGATAGLQVSGLTADTGSEETGGSYAITLQSTKERGVADLLYVRATSGGLYSYASSKAAFNDLLAVPA